MSALNIFLQETESIDYKNPVIAEQINLLKDKSTSDILESVIKNLHVPMMPVTAILFMH